MLPHRNWRNRASSRGKHCWRMALSLPWGKPGMLSENRLPVSANRTDARCRRKYKKGIQCPRTRRIQTRKRLQGGNRNAAQHRSKAGISKNGSGRPRMLPEDCAASTGIKSTSAPQPTRCGKRSRLDKRHSAHKGCCAVPDKLPGRAWKRPKRQRQFCTQPSGICWLPCRASQRCWSPGAGLRPLLCS